MAGYKVSVRLMTYNHEPFIRECLESILMQKADFNIEIVIGDDFSTDKTLNIIRQYKDTENIHIRILEREIGDDYWKKRQAKGRLCNFTNILENCTGEYVALLDGDDYWTDPWKLQKQVELMQLHSPCSMCVALTMQLLESGNETIPDKPYQGRYNPLIYFDDLTQYFQTSTYLIRKSRLDFFLEHQLHLFMGDTTLRYLLIAEAPFVVLNEIVSVYRISESGVWTSMTEYRRNFNNYSIFRTLRRGHYGRYCSFYLAIEKGYLNRLIDHARKTLRMGNYIRFNLTYVCLVLQYNKMSFLKSILRVPFRWAKKKIKYILKDYTGLSTWLIKLIVTVRNIILKDKVLYRKVKHIREYSNSVLENILPGGMFKSIAPNDLNTIPLINQVDIPPLNLYAFDNVLVNSRSSCLFYEDNLIKENYNINERFDEGNIEWHDTTSAMIKKKKVVEIEEGLFLGGNGSWNWYHWITEILPKALYLNTVPTKKLLVSGVLLKYQSMSDTLRALVGDSMELIYMNHNSNYYVKKLYHISNISYVPFNMISGITWKVEDVFMRKDILISMRDKLVAHFINRSTLDSIDKLFIYRTTHRVARNQDALVVEMQQEGFISINFEGLGIADQIHYMQNSTVVMGTSGAAFTNLIFARPGTTFICFMQKGLEGFSCFSNLAAIFGINLVYHFYETTAKPSEHYASGFDLDIKKIKNLYKQAIHEKALPHSIS